MDPTGGMATHDDLEGRLLAHRRALEWVLAHLLDREQQAKLLSDLGETYPPLDHQEDPGAVPDEHFAQFAAQAREMRMILQIIKEAQETASSTRADDEARPTD